MNGCGTIGLVMMILTGLVLTMIGAVAVVQWTGRELLKDSGKSPEEWCSDHKEYDGKVHQTIEIEIKRIVVHAQREILDLQVTSRSTVFSIISSHIQLIFIQARLMAQTFSCLLDALATICIHRFFCSPTFNSLGFS